jgi:hypothetical protein
MVDRDQQAGDLANGGASASAEEARRSPRAEARANQQLNASDTIVKPHMHRPET